jgi:hypothetical protein
MASTSHYLLFLTMPPKKSAEQLGDESQPINAYAGYL